MQDTPELTRQKVKAYGLKVLELKRVDETVFNIETDLFYEAEKGTEILTAYNKAPYDVYVGNLGKVGVEDDGNVKEASLIGHWVNTDLTKVPALTINDLYHQDLLNDNDSVRLGMLSWRAIVPLLQMGYQESDIEGMVEFPIDWFDNFSFNGVSNVEDVVKYYQEVKAGDTKNLELPKSKWNKAYYVDSLEQEEDGKSAVYKSLAIYILLERGIFTPPKHNLFFQAEKWNHDAFR